MPSREIVEILSDEDKDETETAPAKSDLTAEKSESVGHNDNDDAITSTTFDSTTKTSNNAKITPPPTADKKQSATANKKKPKHQKTLADFFGSTGSRNPFTPHANNYKGGGAAKNKKPATTTLSKSTKKSPAKKKQPNSKGSSGEDKSTTNSSKILASFSVDRSGTSSIGKKPRHNKMDFKDVIVGNLSGGRTSATESDARAIHSTTTCPGTTQPARAGNKDQLDAMLPIIPPVGSVQRVYSKKITPPQAEGEDCIGLLATTTNAASQEESEDCSVAGAMGALKSQLVHIFENPPAAEGDSKNSACLKEPMVVKDDDSGYGPKDSPVNATGIEKADEVKGGSEQVPHSLKVSEKDEGCVSRAVIDEEMPDDHDFSDAVMEDRVDLQNKAVENSNASSNNEEISMQIDHGVARQKSSATTSSTERRHGETSAAKANTLAAAPVLAEGQPKKKNGKPKALGCQNDITGSQSCLDAESQALLEKHQALKIKYCELAAKVVNKARNWIEEDDLSITMPPTENISLSPDACLDFPDAAIPHLVVLVEGSNLPLSLLAKNACETLNTVFSGASFSSVVVSAKIKLLASRKAYIKNPAIASGTTVANTLEKETDLFEDTNLDHMWRWEVTSLELLPDEAVKAVKQARSSRRKVQLQFNANAKLLAALNESIKLLQESNATPSTEQVEKVVGKISREEEKVLKFEQEAEKARLLAEAKKQKQTKQQKSKTAEEKKRAAEEKTRAAEERKREKEEEKERKVREREEKAKAEQEKKNKEIERQKKRMMSFFVGAPKQPKTTSVTQDAKPSENTVKALSANRVVASTTGFDSEHFRSCINSHETGDALPLPFASLSRRAVASRKPKSKRVKMRVFVLGLNADDPFAAQPAFSEERIIEVRNRNKFLRFQEDYRPPYHGTWSKHISFKKLGRNPFMKELLLDYENDSEAEWESDDDDPGEDVENDADDEDEKMVDEEGDINALNYQDGWLEADDADLGVEDADMDEETKKLVRESRRRAENGLVPVCIVAPAAGGVPIVDKHGPDDKPLLGKVEGVPVEDAYRLLSCHTGEILTETDIFLDAFPPALVDERESTNEPSSTQPTSEPSRADMQVIARFIHHSTLVSKTQVVEELRNAHPTVTSSRAQAHRVLDSTAEKKRHPESGVYWEVKQDVIDELGLADELKPMQLPEVAKKRKRKNSESAESEPKLKKARANGSAEGTPKAKGSEKKPQVSAASVKLLAAFLKKK